MSKLREMKKAGKENKAINPKLLVLSLAGVAIVAAVAAIALFIAQAPTGANTLPDGEGNAGDSVPPAREIKTFIDLGNEIELENGKPVIRLFSTTWCPHCQWIRDTFDRVMREYAAEGKIAAYHWELDTGDNTMTPQIESSVPASEIQVFQKFNPRSTVPTFIFGGKYLRIGNGFERENDLAAEEAEFRAVIEALLNELNPESE